MGFIGQYKRKIRCLCAQNDEQKDSFEGSELIDDYNVTILVNIMYSFIDLIKI